jgi:hypothetical protein
VSRRQPLVLGLVGVLMAAVLGGAAYAAYTFFSGGGPRPDSALPSSTIAVAALDLDPHAGQKIEAIKTLRKFPALRKQLGIRSQDDLRRYVFDRGVAAGHCTGLDYARDVQPWIGERVALAAVDVGEKQPAPAIALQLSDRARARAGMAKIAGCIGGDFKFAIGEDYVIASDTDAHAREILAAGKKKPLADDPTYRTWTDRAGDQGVLNFYVSPGASKYLADLLGSFAGDLTGFGLDRPGTGAAAPTRARLDGDPLGPVRDALKGFRGLAGTVRFADGGMELSMAVGGTRGVRITHAPAVGNEVGKLPDDTALAVGFGIPKDLAGQVLDTVKGDRSADQFVQQAQTRTGLRFPEDLQTLLGHALTLSIGGEAPKNLDKLSGPGEVPVGLVLHGDSAAALALIQTAEEHLGMKLADLPVITERSGSKLVLSPSAAYARELTKDGGLGKTDAFRNAVPDADRASTIFFLRLDDSWRKAIVSLVTDLSPADADRVEKNLGPLEALGLSATSDGSTSRVRLKIATR